MSDQELEGQLCQLTGQLQTDDAGQIFDLVQFSFTGHVFTSYLITVAARRIWSVEALGRSELHTVSGPHQKAPVPGDNWRCSTRCVNMLIHVLHFIDVVTILHNFHSRHPFPFLPRLSDVLHFCTGPVCTVDGLDVMCILRAMVLALTPQRSFAK